MDLSSALYSGMMICTPAHVAHQAALAVGDAAAVHGVVVRVVYDVDLGVVRVAVLGVPALGYGYLLGLVAVFIVELDRACCPARLL